MLLFLDLETTGLDPNRDHMLEVAWTLTHQNLDEHQVGVREALVTPTTLEIWDRIEANSIVFQMHTQSELYHDLQYSQTTLLLDDIEDQILADVNNSVGTDRPVHLAGASVHFDKGFIHHWMPRLDQRLSHRIFDTSTLKAFFDSLQIHHDVHNPRPHRAANDVREVLEISRFYRSVLRELQGDDYFASAS
jgi:oligoribonuclease